MQLSLAFAHLNLRWNPFGELPRDERAALAEVDVDRFVAPLRAGGFAVQFLGECGRGKTTHLLALHARLSHAPFLSLLEDAPTPPLPTAPLAFVDESQRLSRLELARLLANSRALALGTHRDHAAALRAAGYRCETVHVGGVDEARLARIFARRIEAARRGAGPLPELSAPAVAELARRYGDDVRAMESALYEVFQRLPEVRHVEV